MKSDQNIRNLMPTDFPEVNQTVAILLKKLLHIGEDKIVGIYLSGSIATGDFRPNKSDIDFVVATKGRLSEEVLEEIKRLHQNMRANGLPYTDNIEGDYIPLEAIRKYDPGNATYPHLGNDGHFAIEHHESDEIIQLHVLREYGIAIYGPSPKTLIDEISADDIKKSSRLVLEEWWRPLLEDEVLKISEYQAYAILTMCRALYTLRFGTVVSKQAAADWATTEYGARFAGCIQSSLDWEKGKEIDCYAQAKEMIAFTLNFSAGTNEG